MLPNGDDNRAYRRQQATLHPAVGTLAIKEVLAEGYTQQQAPPITNSRFRASTNIKNKDLPSTVGPGFNITQANFCAVLRKIKVSSFFLIFILRQQDFKRQIRVIFYDNFPLILTSIIQDSDQRKHLNDFKRNQGPKQQIRVSVEQLER